MNTSDAQAAIRLAARFRDWLASLSDEQVTALAGHWENVMDDAARLRVESWVITDKAVALLRQGALHDQETGTGDDDMGRRDPNANERKPRAAHRREAAQAKINQRVNRTDDHRPTEEIPPGPLQREGVWTPRTRRP